MIVKSGQNQLFRSRISILGQAPRLRITSKTLKRSLRTRLRYAQEQTNGIRLNKNLANRLHEQVSF